MTIRRDMRDAVSRAREALGDAVDAARAFLHRQLAPDGGFAGRDGNSDLYYTVFGFEAALALDAGIPRERVADFLRQFDQGQSLDLVHLAGLIRCRANLADAGGEAMDDSMRRAAVQHLQQCKARDGGFNTKLGAERGTAYGTFLALGAYQDLGIACPDPAGIVESICSLQTLGGGYANESGIAAGATTATAAAICVLHYLNRPIPESAVHWLQDRAQPLGGFCAIQLPADAAIPPDLLSTATALHALSLAGALTDDVKEKHLDYLDTLWSPQGGFRGHWADETLDCEYTYYGLLSLGCLAK
jgi:prenyltransferase beta subunit